MGRGPVVQARKNAVNAQKWKVFSLHAKLISLAAQKWGNPDDNPALAAAIAKAKKEWVPNDNIDRSIKKGTGEDADAAQIQEIIYEGYAPGGVALLVSTLTDNKNRTVSNIRHIFSKYGGNLWESGSVGWMFQRKWVIFIDPAIHSSDEVEEIALLTDIEDMTEEMGYIKIITSPENFHTVEAFLEQNNLQILEGKVDGVPDTSIDVTDFDIALKLTKMLQAFDEDEDVNTIASNEVITPEMHSEVDSYIEERSFHT